MMLGSGSAANRTSGRSRSRGTETPDPGTV